MYFIRVAEYQGEDYHLDRSLFLACRRVSKIGMVIVLYNLICQNAFL